MSIRPARLADHASLCSLLAEVENLHAELLPLYFRRVTGKTFSRDALDRLLRVSDETVLVADDDDGNVEGLVHVQLFETPAAPSMVPGRRAHIENLVVAAAARRHGVGSELVSAARAWATRRGASEILLTVWRGNTAAELFYESLGFQRLSSVLALPVG
ncbi:MAG: GNAT family N-acetyltransferase [Pseudomonadota bacterium]